jgi:hypothetical protein
MAIKLLDRISTGAEAQYLWAFSARLNNLRKNEFFRKIGTILVIENHQVWLAGRSYGI